jgi:enoyl-CoA hydratase/carnithine racemase
MCRDYYSVLDQCERDGRVRVAVVTGAGGNFCAGGDMADLGDFAADGTFATDGDPRHPHWKTTTYSFPVVAAVDGYCAGAGLIQAGMSDVRIAGEGAKFSTAFARRGLVAEQGISWLLPRLVGFSAAMELTLTGRVVLAPEALSLGLVTKVVPAGRTLAEAVEFASELAWRCSPSALAVIKRQMWGDQEAGLRETVARADELTEARASTPDFAEGVASFVEKRKPRFSDRQVAPRVDQV